MSCRYHRNYASHIRGWVPKVKGIHTHPPWVTIQLAKRSSKYLSVSSLIWSATAVPIPAITMADCVRRNIIAIWCQPVSVAPMLLVMICSKHLYDVLCTSSATTGAESIIWKWHTYIHSRMYLCRVLEHLQVGMYTGTLYVISIHTLLCGLSAHRCPITSAPSFSTCSDPAPF